MYTPTNITIVGGLPITAIDLSLHTFLGISWLILLPYTLFGVALMIYSQNRLMHGQRALKRDEAAADVTAE
jgi:hypothetical protein